MKRYKAIGLMSGTSCDGLDIAYCEFSYLDDTWSYHILQSKMVEYNSLWRERLRNAPNLSEIEINKLDKELGVFFGEETLKFIRDKSITELDFVASHGHTVFHRPDEGYTLQIGNGEEIKKCVSVIVINDFRSADVAAGGQGAPLVPIGDDLLFSEYDYCLNIGGIANVSFRDNGIRKAHDVCFANMALNPLARIMGYEFDRGGYIASQGIVNQRLLDQLMALDFKGKSLGNEQYQEVFLPILQKSISTTDTKMCTITDYIARKISESIAPDSRVLITGGGAYNTFLIELIQKYSSANIEKASSQLIEYKEALIFAFLGVLKLENVPNCLASVTGANEDVVGGVII